MEHRHSSGGHGLLRRLLNQVKAARRLVIPRVDDCVSLLINGTVQHSANPKQMGHLYITERQPDSHGKRLCQQCPRWKADACYSRWFANHSQLDIVDTGVFDCHSEAYVGLPRNARTRCTAALVMSLAATACWNG